MWTKDRRLGVVFNGEIYNAPELRGQLIARGCIFQSHHSDTEVLLHAYRTWGESFVIRLNGMWAFVIIDLDGKQLFASRDRFGEKPFYYQFHCGEFIFASELGAIREHSSFVADIDTLAIKKYFAYGYIPAPLTKYAKVRKLPAGCNLMLPLSGGAAKVDRYWRFVLEPRNRASDDELGEEFEGLLAQSVKRRLIADVPVGTFLSGGIDSSLLSVLAAKIIGVDRLKTFSIGFDEPSFDESAYSRLVSSLIGSEHHEQRFGVDTLLPIVNDLRGQLCEPLADSSLLPTWLVSRTAREHVTVALGGDGADELFAGYSPFRALRWASMLDAVMPGKVLELGRLATSLLPVSHGYMSLDFKIKRALGGLAHERRFWMPAWMAPVDAAQVNRLVSDGIEHSVEEIYSEVAHAWSDCEQDDLVSKALQFFTEIYLQDNILTKIDRASMMNSLEVRSPFLDNDVVAFARALPVTQKLRYGTTKWLLKNTGLRLLPRPIVNRKKQGFAVPIGRWFREGSLRLDNSRLPAYINIDEVTRLNERHCSGQSDERLFLWAALMLNSSEVANE